MKGGVRLKSEGFTLTEVLIVLAVSTALFVSAITMMAGKQRQAEFNTAIRDVQSQLQQSISEVSTGFYPSLENFRCTASFTGPVLTTAGNKDQGENVGCIFLGKAVQFGVGANPENYLAFSLVGLQRNGSSEVTSLSQAKPVVIAPAATSPASMPDVTQKFKLRGGLKVLWARVNGSGSDLAAVAFVSSLAQYSPGGSKLSSGSQQVEVIPINGSSIGSSAVNAATTINNQLATSSPLSATDSSLQICVVSGSTKQSGLITIGGNGRQLTVNLQVKGEGNTTCA